MTDLDLQEHEEMASARDALYPRPHNPSSVDVIDVARWDAFEAGYRAALAAREDTERPDDELKRLREEAEGTHELLAHFRDDRRRLTRALRTALRFLDADLFDRADLEPLRSLVRDTEQEPEG